MKHTYIPMTKDEKEKEFRYFVETLESFLEFYEIPNENFFIDDDIFHEMLERVHQRKAYHSYFNEGSQLAEYKALALYVFWILKLRPFSAKATNSTPKAKSIALRICEHFSLHILHSYIQHICPDFFYTHRKMLHGAYKRELLHSFRYRDLSKEALYLQFSIFHHKYDSTADSIHTDLDITR